MGGFCGSEEGNQQSFLFFEKLNLTIGKLGGAIAEGLALLSKKLNSRRSIQANPNIHTKRSPIVDRKSSYSE